MRKLGAAILAGGKSTRMGSDKALIKYSGQTFLNRLIEQFSLWDELMVAGGAFCDYDVQSGVRLLRDENEGIGPIEGIRQVLKNTECDYVFICAVDMPQLTEKLAAYMAEFISSDYDCYVIRDEKHIHPLCAIYSKAVLGRVESLIAEGKYRLMELLSSVRTKYISLENTVFKAKQVANVNTRTELKEISLPVVFCVSGTKNSGKTWLISRLINEFISEGYRVGVIKHDGHDYEMDHRGSDTHTFYEHGAAYAAIFSDKRYSINVSSHTEPKELLEGCPGTDAVIFEGMKSSDLPKLWMSRSDPQVHPAPPVISRVDEDPDVHAVYNRIKEYFSL